MRRTQKGFTVVGTLIMIVVIAAVAFSGYWVWHNHNKKEVGPNGLTQAQQIAVDKGELANIHFQLYSYQTSATIFSRSISTFYKPTAFLNGDDPNYKYDNPKYAHLVEWYNKIQADDLTVRQFDASLYKGGPATCTPLDPEFPDYLAEGYKCAEVGVTSTGTPIFAAISAVDQSYMALFTTIGSTSITIDIIHSRPSMNGTMLAIMKTLTPINKNNIKFVEPTSDN